MGASFFIRLFKTIKLFTGDGITMAYNVLKGKVDGSVDQYGDQEIGGVKIFKSTISASVFYDTDAMSPCATMKDVAITKIVGGTKENLLTYEGDSEIKAHHDLTYDGVTLQSHHIRSKLFMGSGKSLTDLPANKFYEKINAVNLNFGRGLHNVRKELQVKAINGLEVDEDGVGISLSPTSGLSIRSKNLVVDPTKMEAINIGGQNLSDQDLLMVSDISKGSTKSTTLKNLYDSYISIKMHRPSGKKNEIQWMGSNEFDSSPNLTYDGQSDTLAVDGKIKTSNLKVDSTIVCTGAVYYNINKVTSAEYNVQSEDYTILCDASQNKIKVILPPAVNNNGRILIIKKANSDKYKINSNQVDVLCKEGRIDINDTMPIKMNYSSRTLQSDGENWWIIGTKGS